MKIFAAVHIFATAVHTFAMENFDEEWKSLLEKLGVLIGKKPADLNAVLFLIGVQELGKGPLNFSKEQKQDLMHIATCKLLSLNGYYTLAGIDDDGWPHWKKSADIPKLSLKDQELLLKQNAIQYFKDFLE